MEGGGQGTAEQGDPCTLSSARKVAALAHKPKQRMIKTVLNAQKVLTRGNPHRLDLARAVAWTLVPA